MEVCPRFHSLFIVIYDGKLLITLEPRNLQAKQKYTRPMRNFSAGHGRKV